jgi:hypothetical protein
MKTGSRGMMMERYSFVACLGSHCGGAQRLLLGPEQEDNQKRANMIFQRRNSLGTSELNERM